MVAHLKKSSLPPVKRPAIGQADALADTFRYWQGASGDRYVFTEVDLNDVEDYTDSVVLLLDGRRRSGFKLAYLGEAGPDHKHHSQRLAKAKRSRSMRAFIHLLAEDADRRKQIIADLAAAA